MSFGKRAGAELLGTFWLVFGGCGAAVLDAAFPNLGIGFVGVALAFGLTVLTMAFAIGHISGCHLNPAISVGLAVGKRFPASELPAYIGAQLVGAIIASGVLYVIASGKPGFDLGGFASNGYDIHSPGGYSLLACLVTEIVLTFMFLIIIFGSTTIAAHRPGFCSNRHRSWAHSHPPGRHSRDQHVGQSCTQHRSRDFCRWLGATAALALLGRAHSRRNLGGNRISGDLGIR